MAAPTTSLGFPVAGLKPCQWGKGVKTADDLLPCLGLAERRLTLIRKDSMQRDFELCPDHTRKLLQLAEQDGHTVL